MSAGIKKRKGKQVVEKVMQEILHPLKDEFMSPVNIAKKPFLQKQSYSGGE